MSSLVSLDSYWNATRGDNLTTATRSGRASAEEAGYSWLRREAEVFMAPSKLRSVLALPADAVPLTLHWSAERQDNFTSIVREAPPGYEAVRVEGFVYRDLPKTRAFTRLRLWWNAKRGDNFLSGTDMGDAAARASGYTYLGTQAYAPASAPLEVVGDDIERGAKKLDYSVTVRGSGFSPLEPVRFYQLFLSGPHNPGEWNVPLSNGLEHHHKGERVEYTAKNGSFPKITLRVKSQAIYREYADHRDPVVESYFSGPSLIIAVDLATGAEVLVGEIPATE
ncbi:hypothetical protein BH09ACT3_BH09ACT3_16350 [soil metagenome]